MPDPQLRTGVNLTRAEWAQLEALTRKLAWSQDMGRMSQESLDIVNGVNIYASRMMH